MEKNHIYDMTWHEMSLQSDPRSICLGMTTAIPQGKYVPKKFMQEQYMGIQYQHCQH